MVKRIDTLDYLRGLLALCILSYHYTLWAGIKPDLSSPLSRIGIYGVAVFYILSGLTHFMIHKHKVTLEPKSLYAFAVKRFFRIMPLLWVIIGLTILINNKKAYGWESILLNVTSLFGFVDPGNYIAVGSWSIGNEMVYYALFPIAVWLINKNKHLFIPLLLLNLAWCMYVALYLMTKDKTLAEQWPLYINPFTNLIFFSGGIYISTLADFQGKINPWVLRVGLIALILLFLFIPLSGNQINFVAGMYRLLFVMIALLICTALFLDDFQLPKPIHVVLKYLSTSSYSIYLLHPIFYLLLTRLNYELRWHLSIYWLLGIAFTLTIPTAYFTMKYIELQGARIGQWILGEKK